MTHDGEEFLVSRSSSGLQPANAAGLAVGATIVMIWPEAASSKDDRTVLYSERTVWFSSARSWCRPRLNATPALRPLSVSKSAPLAWHYEPRFTRERERETVVHPLESQFSSVLFYIRGRPCTAIG